jgi:hypothetical protein
MTTAIQSTVGTTVYILDKSVSPHLVIAVAALKGFSGVGGGKRKKIDASNMDSQGYNENAGGRADPPEASGEIVLKKSVVGHQKLKKLFEAQANGTVGNIDIYVGDGDAANAPTVVAGVLVPPQTASPKHWARSGTLGSGYISSLSPKKVDDDIDRADFAFQFSGGATWQNKGDVIATTY